MQSPNGCLVKRTRESCAWLDCLIRGPGPVRCLLSVSDVFLGCPGQYVSAWDHLSPSYV